MFPQVIAEEMRPLRVALRGSVGNVEFTLG
jgi:hypothetical protein